MVENDSRCRRTLVFVLGVLEGNVITIQAKDIVEYVFSIAPDLSFEQRQGKASENIYEYGSAEAQVTGIAVAWWITTDMLRDFVVQGINLGLTHERVIYDCAAAYMWGPTTNTCEVQANIAFKRLIETGSVTIHRFHSNIDLASWGMPDALLDQLGWNEYPLQKAGFIPIVDIPGIKLSDLIQHIKRSLDIPFVRFDGDSNQTIRRVALPWGGLCQGWDALSCCLPFRVDCVIGGDVIEGVVRLAREERIAVIDAFHYATELSGVKRLADILGRHFPNLKVKYYENDMPWQLAV